MPIINAFTELVNNIRNSVDDLVDQILDPSNRRDSAKYKRDGGVERILSDVNPQNWLGLVAPYTFSVVSNSSTPFGDFSLPIAPQSISQEEPFAVRIRPTQGGTTVTHSGNKYKDLIIKGTTGIQPFRGTGGVNRKTGEAIGQPGNFKYKSGYEVFLELRNWFRSYYEWKKLDPQNSRSARLVFKNFKDGEFLICELVKFGMDRQAAKPHLYDYSLQFRVIGHQKFKPLDSETNSFNLALDRAVEQIDNARGAFLRTQGILRQIESTYNANILSPLRRTSLAIKTLRNLPTVAADISERTLRNTMTELDTLALSLNIKSRQKENARTGGEDPRITNISLPNDLEAAVSNQGSSLISSWKDGLMAIDSSDFPEATRLELEEDQVDSQNLPRLFFENTITELKRIRANAEDFFNLGSAQYDSIFDRTSSLNADVNKTITQEEIEVLQAFNEAISSIQILLATDDLFKSSFEDRIQDMIDRFDNNIELFASQATKELTVESGMTLPKLAQLELGDSTRWGEIVELNNLKPPYIVNDNSTSLESVLKPGDKILVPAPISSGFSQVPNTREIKTTKGLTELEKSLGTDLRLTSDFDLTLSSSGDIEVISGTDNMAQQVILKLSYEKGEVIRYPDMGAGIEVGSKFPKLQDIRDGIVDTLLQDNRIDSITDLTLRQDNSELSISFNLFIKQIDIPVPITIKV